MQCNAIEPQQYCQNAMQKYWARAQPQCNAMQKHWAAVLPKCNAKISSSSTATISAMQCYWAATALAATINAPISYFSPPQVVQTLIKCKCTAVVWSTMQKYFCNRHLQCVCRLEEIAGGFAKRMRLSRQQLSDKQWLADARWEGSELRFSIRWSPP